MQDPVKLKEYVELLAKRHGGIEGLRHDIQTKMPQQPSPQLEAFGLELESGSSAAKSTVQSGLEALERNAAPSMGEQIGLEAIINEELRPAIEIVNGTFTSVHPLWPHLSGNPEIAGRLRAAIPAVGRIELPGSTVPYGGTGFRVGKNLIMTNRHVAEIFATGLGTRHLRFKNGAGAGIDFLKEQGLPPNSGRVLKVVAVVMIHPFWDMALLQVEGLDPNGSSLKLSLEDGRDLVGREIAVIGYPAFDGRNPAGVQNTLFNGRFGIKRLQPGLLQGGMQTGSFQKLVNAATHDCSTLGGNSGSALVDLATGTVLALHFGGLYHQQNFAVPSSELARDQRVVDAGVSFSSTPRVDATDWADWWRDADARETTPDTHSAPSQPASPSLPQAVSTAPTLLSSAQGNTLTMDIPVRITISIGTGTILGAEVKPAAETVAEAADVLEAMREPWHDDDYSSRQGYQAGFLNIPGQHASLAPVTVDMPSATDPSVLATTSEGGTLLHYQNFSVAMHAKRRLALFTASNVTGETKLRRPEAGKDYTRKGLSGLGENDQEKWFTDSRLDAKFQLPDVFFTKDRKAFDKGHIVRRDDVAWGKSYEKLKLANGDTYHVTNCSPQVKGYNQSAQGEVNWGDLENKVLAQAANERLCVFAGPVLAPDDQVFTGVGAGGTVLKARIPSRFWKVVVTRVADGLAAYGFVLEQDLSGVAFESVESAEFEFVVPAEFEPFLYPLSEIEEMSGITFPEAVRAADQFSTIRGGELEQIGGPKRRRTKTRA